MDHETSEVSQYDVVVVGSGTAGLTASVVAAQLGLRVLLVEKTRYFGGTSAWSGGGCWLPNNPIAASVGLEDNQPDAERYVTGVVGKHLRRDLYAAFVANSNAMLAFLQQRSEVKFFARSPMPDWRQDVDGAKIGGRSLASPAYDGRLLGREMLRKLQRPLASFNAPMGMMMSPLDFTHAMKMFRSRTSFRYMAKLFGRFAVDLVRYGRGSRLTMGNALVARLLRSAMDAGVILWTETPAVRLEQDTGRMNGLVVLRDGKTVRVGALRGIVLATGGFGANALMRACYYGESSAGQPSMVSEGNEGEGITMALTNGAVVETDNQYAAAWDIVSGIPNRTGPKYHCLHFFTDLPKPGNIVVGPDGRRFGNEANHQLGKVMLAAGIDCGWIICDHRSIRKYGVGLVWPYAINLGLLERAGYVQSERSLAELANKIGIDPAVLEHTVARFNGFAAAGVDDDFRRGGSPLDRGNGDPSHRPNPSLGPIEVAPFHAVAVRLGDAGSVCGLRVDARARVLDSEDLAIPGLYALGMDMSSIWAGAPIGAGMNHSHNMTFAYIAAQDMAAQSTSANQMKPVGGGNRVGNAIP